MSCRHGTAAQFSRWIDGVRWWTCSTCGGEFRWSDRAYYLGNLECTGCGTAAVERVECGCTPCVDPIDDDREARVGRHRAK